MTKLKDYTTETDKHLSKYLPLQISSFLYDVLATNFKNRARPKLKDYFSSIFYDLEANLKSEGTHGTSNFNFSKCEYTINSFLMNQSFNQRASFEMSSERKSGDSKIRSYKNTNTITNKKVFVLHHNKKKNPF